MTTETAKIISYPKASPQTESSRVEEAGQAAATNCEASSGDFLDVMAQAGIDRDRLQMERRRVLGEIEALRSENRWREMVDLFHPVQEKVPELEASGLAASVRSELAFAFGQLGRFDEAIALYQACLDEDPDRFHYHAGLAYTAYDSLYAAKGRQIMLHPSQRKARIELAHRHFAAAQKLRPDRVTNYYRQGMLYKQIQGKKDLALPLFETAVRNWDRYSREQRKTRHQERKNFVKALYQMASCLLDGGRGKQALAALERCLQEDQGGGVLSPVHKYFALGKVHLNLGRVEEARKVLEVAAAQADPAEADYVFELLARSWLLSGQPDKAWEVLERIPLKRRRPYVRWTEADILVALGKTDQARRVLAAAAERDRLGRHKALMRLVRLEFRRNCYAAALNHAEQADQFFRNRYGNPFHQGLFWKAAALLRLARLEEARAVALELQELRPSYPKLKKLLDLTEASPPG